MSATARLVVVDYDGADVLPRCLDSLARTIPAEIPITLLDNASPVLSESLIPNYLKSRFEITRLEKNIGYAGAIAEAWSIGDENFLVFTNNDLEFTSGWLDALTETADKTGAHAVSAVIEHENESELEKTTNASLNPLLYLIPGVFPDRTKAVYPSGACFLLRRDPNLIGPPVDPDYFLYYEDVYIGFLLRSLGKTVVQCPEARVKHAGSHSVGRANPNRVAFLRERNRWMTQIIFFDLRTLFDIAFHTNLDWCIKIPQCWARGKPVFATLAAHWWVWLRIRSILRKRAALRELDDFDPRRILPYLTSMVLPASAPGARFFNSLSSSWLKSRGMPVDREAGE